MKSKGAAQAVWYSLAAFLVLALPVAIFFWQMGTIWVYVVAQILYFLMFVVIFYLLTRKVNWVSKDDPLPPADKTPMIIMAYPVLHEDEKTIHTAMLAMSKQDYPPDKFKVIAIPNYDDADTIAALQRVKMQFDFLEILEVPSVSDLSWAPVWNAWESNPKAYWWHKGATKGVKDLPPKKTRQLLYLLYTAQQKYGADWVLNYIDADSIVPVTHFKSAAAGLQKYDILQSTDVVGNLMDTASTSVHGFDHLGWDAMLYPHMSANGKHPFYVLGKGVFYRARDLYDLGGFNPWIAIEDPEIGLRYWANGKKLGIIKEPLIEEVPQTFIPQGIVQRNRWMCGFFQTMASPLKEMGIKFWQRQLARLNLVPVMSFLINLIGIPSGVWAVYLFANGQNPYPLWAVILSIVNIVFYISLMTAIYVNSWKVTKPVLDGTGGRLSYFFTVNPFTLFIYWLLWLIPIAGGFFLWVTGQGKAWARTQKVDADRRFVETGKFVRNSGV